MKRILVAYFLTSALAFSRDLWFSQMGNGDRVEVTLQATGCFHNTTSYFEIRKSRDLLSFREYAITWNKSSPPEILSKKMIGEVNLAETDIEGLDGLLKYYRDGKQGNSTSQVFLRIEYYESGALVKVEDLQDYSGNIELKDRKSVVTFFALAKRFQNKDIRP